jgi:hypothetical protein
LLKKERYRGNGRYMNRILLLISIFGILELVLKTFETYLLNNTDINGIQKTSVILCSVHRFMYLFTEIINGLLITLITISLFVVIVLNVTVIELESHEYTIYLSTAVVSLFCTVIGFIKAKNDESLYFPNVDKKYDDFYINLEDYLSREAITINEINCTNFFTIMTGLLILFNGALYSIILIKCLFPIGKKYFKSSPVNYVISLMGYYIVYIIKWIGFLAIYYFEPSNYKRLLFYSCVTSIMALQGFLNFIVFMVKPLYRYSSYRKIYLINKFKKNEKEALKRGNEVSLENYQILESLNEDEDYNYDDKNTEINVIALTLFQMVLCAASLLSNMGIILTINRNNKNSVVTIYTFMIILTIMIVLVCTYFGIISVLKNNLRNMKIYMVIQWMVLITIVIIELFISYLLLVKPDYLKRTIGCGKSKNKSNWQSCETSQISYNLFNFIVMRHIMTFFNIYYLRYYNCSYSIRFKSLIFESVDSDDNENGSQNDIYSNPIVSDYESTVFLAIDDADDNEQNMKVEHINNKYKINKIKGKSTQINNINNKIFNSDDTTSPMNVEICKARNSNCTLNNSVVNATLNSATTITNSFMGKINNQNINNNYSQEALNIIPNTNISNKPNILLDDSSSEQNINIHSTLKNNDTNDDSDSDSYNVINNNITRDMNDINNINIFKDNNIIMEDSSNNQNKGISSGSHFNNTNGSNVSSEAYLDVNYSSHNNSSTFKTNSINSGNLRTSTGISYDTLISYKQAQENEKIRMRGINTLSYVDINRDIEVENDILQINNNMARVAGTSMTEHNINHNNSNNSSSNASNSNNYLFINNKLNPHYTSKLSEEPFNNNTIVNESFSSTNKIISINSYKSKRSSIDSSSVSLNKFNRHLSSNVGNDKNSIAPSVASTRRVRKYTPIVPLKKSKKLDPHGDWWIEMAMPVKNSSVQPSIVYSSKPSKPKSRSHQSYSHSYSSNRFYTSSNAFSLNSYGSTSNSHYSHSHNHNHIHHHHSHSHNHSHSHSNNDKNSQKKIYSLIIGSSSSKKDKIQKKSKDKLSSHCHYRIPNNNSETNSQNSGFSNTFLNLPKK